MRTLRMLLVGTGVLALLAGMGAVTIAQAEPETPRSAESTQLSFTVGHGVTAGAPLIGVEEGRVTYRNHRYDSFIEANDPRLTGDWWSIWNYDVFRDTGLYVSSAIVGIDNEAGSWRGTIRSYSTPWDALVYELLDLTGEGAYEGLTTRMFWVPMESGPIQVEGIVFNSEFPPFPELPTE